MWEIVQTFKQGDRKHVKQVPEALAKEKNEEFGRISKSIEDLGTGEPVSEEIQEDLGEINSVLSTSTIHLVYVLDTWVESCAWLDLSTRSQTEVEKMWKELYRRSAVIQKE